ncbi:hypothetical protein ABPG74_016980 [Tetrahymena malaccensis]
MSQEVIQNVEIRDIQQMLLPISSADEDRQLLTFLAGALYAYGQVEKALLSSLISKIAQLFQISQQNGQNEIKQTIFRSLINNTQQKPLIYVEELSKSIEGQIICKENNEINCWNIKSNFYDENQEEEEEESKEMNEIKGQLNQIHQQLKGMQYSGDINNLNYVCKICQDQTESEDFYYAECNHIFHNQCLAQYLNEQISKKNIQLKCPHANCQYDIPQTTLKQILNQEQFEAFQQVSLSTFLNTNDLQVIFQITVLIILYNFLKIQRCPTKDCLFAFVNEDNLTLLDCPFCKKIYCLSCNCLYHENLTCQEHQMLIGNQEIKGREQDLDRKESLPFKNNQDKHQSLQNKQLEDENDWNCEICCENMTNSLYLPLSCDHIFHKKCLSQYFNTQISEKKFPINCPSSTCNLPVQQYDLEEVLNVDEFQKYEQFCLQNYIDSNQDEMSWCLTPNCGYAFILVSGQYSLDCPKCMKSYCLNCKCEYHKNQTCQEYKISKNFTEDDQKLEQLAIDQKFKKCSKCKMWVEKNQGCDHMTCRCGHQFCYKCGGPYLQCGCPLYNNLNLIRQLDHQDLMNSSLFDEQVIYNNYSYEFNDDSSDDDDIDLPFNHTRIYPQNSFNFYIQQNQMSNFNFQQRQTQMINQQNQRQNDLNQFRPQNQKFGFKFQQSQSQIRNQQFFQQNIPNLKNNLEQNQISGNNDHFQNMHQIGKDQNNSYNRRVNGIRNDSQYQNNQNSTLQFDSMISIQRQGSLLENSQINLSESQHYFRNSQTQHQLIQDDFPQQKKQSAQDLNTSNNRRKNKRGNDNENIQNNNFQHLLIYDDFPYQKKQFSQESNTSNNRRKYKRGTDNENIQNNNFNSSFNQNEYDLNIQFSPNPFTQPENNKYTQKTGNRYNKNFQYQNNKNSTFEFKDMTSVDNEKNQNNRFNSSFYQNESNLNMSPNPFIQPESNQYTEKRGSRYNSNSVKQNNRNSTSYFNEINQEVLSATSIQNQEISQDKFQLNELEKIQNSQNEHQKMQHDFNNQQQQQVSQDKNTDSNRRKYKKPKKFNQENNIN